MTLDEREEIRGAVVDSAQVIKNVGTYLVDAFLQGQDGIEDKMLITKWKGRFGRK